MHFFPLSEQHIPQLLIEQSCGIGCDGEISIREWVYNKTKEGSVLFNDALNTLNLRLYGVRHMVKEHSNSERGNPLPPHGLLFPISSNSSFICTIPHTTAFVKPVMEHWLETEIA